MIFLTFPFFSFLFFVCFLTYFGLFYFPVFLLLKSMEKSIFCVFLIAFLSA